MLSSFGKSVLLLILGIGLLVNPYAPGIHHGQGSVYRYETAAVSYDQSDGLQVTNPKTGKQFQLQDVDDEIVCYGHATQRLCQFEYAVYNGSNISSLSENFGASHYQYVYFYNTLFRPTNVKQNGEWYMSLEQVNESDPLRNVAEQGVLSDGARTAIKSGSVMTYRELPEDDTLVLHNGQYYTFYKSGSKQYSRNGGSFCSSGGDGFCSDADTKRLTDTLLTLGSLVLGVALVVSAFWSRRQS
jgi:hypothetical protein